MTKVNKVILVFQKNDLQVFNNIIFKFTWL